MRVNRRSYKRKHTKMKTTFNLRAHLGAIDAHQNAAKLHSHAANKPDGDTTKTAWTYTHRAAQATKFANKDHDLPYGVLTMPNQPGHVSMAEHHLERYWIAAWETQQACGYAQTASTNGDVMTRTINHEHAANYHAKAAKLHSEEYHRQRNNLEQRMIDLKRACQLCAVAGTAWLEAINCKKGQKVKLAKASTLEASAREASAKVGVFTSHTITHPTGIVEHYLRCAYNLSKSITEATRWINS